MYISNTVTRNLARDEHVSRNFKTLLTKVSKLTFVVDRNNNNKKKDPGISPIIPQMLNQVYRNPNYF